MIASSSILLTKRTIGASSTSSRVDRLGVEVFVAGRDIEVLEIEIVLGHVGHRGIDLLDRLGDRQLQLVVFDDHGLDAEAAGKLDLVDRMQIGGVRDRQEQALAAPQERQDPVLEQQLVADELDRLQVELDRVQVQERYAEFVGGGDRDFACAGGTAGDELGDDADPSFLGSRHGLHHGGLVHKAILDEPLRQTAQAGLAGAKRHHGVVIHRLFRTGTSLTPRARASLPN